MFKKCEKCGNPMGAAVGRWCDDCKKPEAHKLSVHPPDLGAAECEVEEPQPVQRTQRRDPKHRDRAVSSDVAKVELTPGQPCPTCGKPVGLSNTERQRRWRQKQREQKTRA